MGLGVGVWLGLGDGDGVGLGVGDGLGVGVGVGDGFVTTVTQGLSGELAEVWAELAEAALQITVPAATPLLTLTAKIAVLG